MRSFHKKVRHYYWFTTSFVKKNLRSIIISFVAAFFGIVFIINFFPLFNSLVFSSRKVTGLIGQYPVQSPPAEIAQLISIPLITTDQKGELQPVLANSWEVLNDGKLYRFHLKTDLFWYDKKRFKATDIAYSFQDVTIKAIDDYTIDFNLKQPLTIFPIYLAKPVLKLPLIGIGGQYEVQSYVADKNILKSVSLSPNKQGLPYLIYNFYKT
ncbi:MAG: putative binding protein YgiS precursor, partial [Microgenomates bacterium OLB23]